MDTKLVGKDAVVDFFTGGIGPVGPCDKVKGKVDFEKGSFIVSCRGQF